MVAVMRKVFDANERDGLVAFDYNTEVYYGRLK